MSSDSTSRWEFAAPNSGAVARHFAPKHPEFYQKYNTAKKTEESINSLIADVEKANDAAFKRLEKLNAKKLQYFRRLDNGLTKKMRPELCLVSLAVANNVPRVALNYPLFDAYHVSIGAEPTSNRHDLAGIHVEALDNLVVAQYKKTLASRESVEMSQDGWKDRAKRNWVDLGQGWLKIHG